MSTELLYLSDMQQLECKAFIEKIENRDGKTVVYLDQTVFYPQGGGQPYDKGVINTPDSELQVEEVRYVDGLVQHIGTLSGQPLMQGEDVSCAVDAERRVINTAYHSGGHVIDMAIDALGYSWMPTKGHHYPGEAYIEYLGELSDEDIASLGDKLTAKLTELTTSNIATELRFVPVEKMDELCRHVPSNIPKDKPGRVVMYGDFGVPCGGTHTASLNELEGIKIRKIKSQNGKIKISYEV